MKYGSLFSGIGGMDLGLDRAGMECVWQVEIDDWCREVLTKHWPDVPKYGDIKELSGEELEPVDLVAGGFPCQPFSNAGRRDAEADNRYLWPEMFRLIRAVQPRFVLAENVYGLVSIGEGVVLETVYSDLADAGYEVAPPIVFPAAALGALHRRDRVWICAHSRHDNGRTEPELKQAQRPEVSDRVRADDSHADGSGLEGRQRGVVQERAGERAAGPVGTLADTPRQRLDGAWASGPAGRNEPTDSGWWESEPAVGRVANGVPRRVDRLRGLGNAVVPQVAEFIGKRIMETSREDTS